MLRLIQQNAPEIRMAVIGLGKMGALHVEALRELISRGGEHYYKGNVSELLKKLRVCGLCDRDKHRFRNYQDFPCYENLRDLIRDAKANLAIVASPTLSHVEVATMLLQNGIHSLIEKPIATSKADLNKLLSIADANGCRLMSAHVERYNPVAVTIRALLFEALSADQSYSFERVQKHSERIPDDIVTDKLIHDLDLAICFFGSVEDLQVLRSKSSNGKLYEVEIALSHKQGAKGKILVSWLVEGEKKKREVTIHRGAEHWVGDFLKKKLWIDSKEVACHVAGMCEPTNNQVKDEIVDFLAYSCEWDPNSHRIDPLLHVDEIVEAITLLDKIRELLRT